MTEQKPNGQKPNTRTILWILGILVTLSVVAYGIVYSVASEGVDRARNNEIMIGRFDEKIKGLEKGFESLENNIDEVKGDTFEIKELLRVIAE